MSPWRLDEFRAKVSFTTSARMPSLVYRACLATDTVSNTRYYQEAVCERLSRDLGVSLEELLSELPPARGPSGHLFDPEDHSMDRYRKRSKDLRGVALVQSGGTVRVGPANTDEEVR